MKKLILMLIVLGTMSFTTTTNELTFCDGWSDGYKKGWCYQRTLGCIEPIVPLCPVCICNARPCCRGSR